MNVFTYCGAAIFCVVVLGVLKSVKSDLTPYAAAASGLILLASALKEMDTFNELTLLLKSYGGGNWFEVMLKALLIAILCQFTSETCKDFGESTLASKVEMGGKIAIIGLSVPLVKEILNSATAMF